MSTIKCPHCGHWQEAHPHVILCEKCYANIKDTVDTHFRETGEEPTEDLDQPERPVWRGPFEQNWPGAAFLMRIWKKRDQAPKKRRRLSGFGVIFRRTFGTFVTRFWALFPLMYLSLSFFMLIGIFLSVIGVQTVFPEEYPADPSMTPAFALGIGASLFVFLYTQESFIFAVASSELGLGDALAKALRRFGSYVGLVALMMASIGAGTGLHYVIGVIVGILFSFAPFVFAKENAGLIKALSKSVQYVARSWLQVLLRLAPVALLVLFSLYFYAYVSVPILMLIGNEFAFIFIVSGLMSLPVMLITIFAFTVYEDLREAALPVPLPGAVPIPSEGAVPSAVAAPAGISPFTDLLGRSWGVYKKRFVRLTILNLISYLPHAIYVGFLIAAYFGLKAFSGTLHSLGATSEYSIVVFVWLWSALPTWILVLVIAGGIVCLILWYLLQVFGVVLYLLLELAYVYAIGDDTVGTWEAMKKARTRLRGFFWTELYRNFIVSTGWALVIPGAAFWVWYQFTPFVFALQREEGTPLSSLWESRELVRGLWGSVFKDLISLQVLPVVIVLILLSFAFAGLPFYWIFGTLLFPFTGHHAPWMLSIHDPHFWGMLSFCFFVVVGGFYLPFQKVVMYVLYRDLKDVKASRSHESI